MLQRQFVLKMEMECRYLLPSRVQLPLFMMVTQMGDPNISGNEMMAPLNETTASDASVVTIGWKKNVA